MASERYVLAGLALGGTLIGRDANATARRSCVRARHKQLPTAPEPELYIHHKLKNVLVTHADDARRRTLFSHLRSMGLPRLISVVREPRTSERECRQPSTRSRAGLAASYATALVAHRVVWITPQRGCCC